MKKIFLLFIIVTGIYSCRKENHSTDTVAETYTCPMQCEGDKSYASRGTCPVCKMDLASADRHPHKIPDDAPVSDMSLFNLESGWTDQDGKQFRFKDFRGHVLVMVMIYTSCKASCPRLVADMRNIEKQLSERAREQVKMIFISIDPETDTPERLKAFARENLMDSHPWIFLRSNEENTREFAAVVAVSYREISPIDFSHSNIISVFDHRGELVFQQEGLGVNPDNLIIHIEKAARTLP